jgi:UTP--glucose-1-phosphate uridylyltransferase
MGSVVSVNGMVEKPKPGEAPSNLAVIGRYILSPQVMSNLNKIKSGAGGEIQLTDAIAREIEASDNVYGFRFRGPAVRLRLQGRVPAGHCRLRHGAR